MVTEHDPSDLGGPDVVGDVDADSLSLEDPRKVAERLPGDMFAGGGRRVRRHRATRGSIRVPLADKYRRHSLTQLALGADRVDNERYRRFGHHIDEARGNHAVGRVDDPRGIGGIERADGGNAVTAHPDVTPKPRVPGAIDNAGVADEEVESCYPPWRGGRCENGGQRCQAAITQATPGTTLGQPPKPTSECAHDERVRREGKGRTRIGSV